MLPVIIRSSFITTLILARIRTLHRDPSTNDVVDSFESRHWLSTQMQITENRQRLELSEPVIKVMCLSLWMRSMPCLLVLLLAAPVLAEPTVGQVSVTDSDTVTIRGTRVRLYGVDAPESAQLCQDATGKAYRFGQASAMALLDRIGEAPISCKPRDTDRYGRTVAVCRKDTEDLNEWMVTRGHAVAYRRYSSDYVQAEAAAKAAKRGIWAGSFTAPAEWRGGERKMGMGFSAPGGPD